MLNIDSDKLKELYFSGKTCVSIADEFKCCTGTIFERINKMGLHREKVKNIEDITGQVFGDLTALRYIRNDKFGKAIWKVRCVCGKEKEINASGMKAGIVLSCGCYKRRKLSKGHGNISGAYWRKLYKSAVVRNLIFEITIQEAWEIFLKQGQKCALSGVPIILHANNDRSSIQTASLDRIDSTIGYTANNVQWIHKRVNFLKRNYPEQELVFWCTKISKHSKKIFKDMNPIGLIERRKLNENIKSI